MQEFIEFLSVVSWPLTVIFVAFLLRKELQALLQRLQSAKLPGGALLSFDKTPLDRRPRGWSAADGMANSPNSDFRRVGNLFWLAHDLMWTIDILLREAPRKTIAHGLRQSLHHLRGVGLTGSPVEEKLSRILDMAERSLESDWTADRRISVAQDVRDIANTLGDFVESQQTDFKPNPSVGTAGS